MAECKASCRVVVSTRGVLYKTFIKIVSTEFVLMRKCSSFKGLFFILKIRCKNPQHVELHCFHPHSKM